MADSAVAITAGAGTNIDTRTESTNSNHRQVIVIGDPATNAGVAPVDFAAGLKVDLGADNDVTVTSGTITAVTAITNALPAGSNAIGKLAANSGVIIGAVEPAAATSGGCSTDHRVSAASTNAANIKASAGQVYGVDIFNNAAYPVYVKFHNTAGAPTAGAGVVRTIGVQAGVGRRLDFPLGLVFSTGIGISIVKGIADADTTAVAASDCVVDVDYK